MNKNTKNALLLSAVMAMTSGAMATTSTYDDNQFDATGPKLTRKNSMGEFGRMVGEKQADLEARRVAYKAEVANRKAQKESDIAHIDTQIATLPANEASIPGLVPVPDATAPTLPHDLTKWPNQKEKTKLGGITYGDAQRANQDIIDNFKDPNADAIKAAKDANEALVKQWKNTAATLKAKKDLIEAAKTTRDKWATESDAVKAQTRAEELADRFKADANATTLISSLGDLANDFSDKAADRYIADMKQARQETNDAVSKYNADMKQAQQELSDAVSNYTTAVSDLDALLSALIAAEPQSFAGLTTNSDPAKFIAVINARHSALPPVSPTADSAASSGHNTPRQAPAPVTHPLADPTSGRFSAQVLRNNGYGFDGVNYELNGEVIPGDSVD